MKYGFLVGFLNTKTSYSHLLGNELIYPIYIEIRHGTVSKLQKAILN